MGQQRALTEVREYVPTGAGNLFLDCGDFGISYNPNPFEGVGLLASDNGGDETAICAGGQFYILNGDFRDEYAALASQGLGACLRFFASKPELVSSWSRSPADALSTLSEPQA